MKKNLLVLICCLFAFHNLKAQHTKIYVLRHAEKNTSDPKDKNPSLSPEGQERANNLVSRLSKEKIDAIFTTNYKRTIETVQPLATAQKASIHKYNPAYPKTLSDLIKKDYAGKTVLIVGHSDTVLELLEAFGVKRPMERLTDSDYDNLFLVTIDGTESKVAAEKFGKPHHSL
jgi:2,3-bisphosphoglycerate-dependent phosphoglycerate mutase